MLNNSNEFTRRILNFPAIRPCDSVSFSTLLTSLINLGHNICDFKSRTFFTNKKNARITIRLIQTLVVFLEEIRDGISLFDDSILVTLFELHFIFQKVHFLLEDCTKHDAKLWMLMKSEKVATHFRIFTRAIAVALDVMPCIGFYDVQELVEFVKAQALKAAFEVEKDDRRSTRRVLRILDQFKYGIAPESIDLRKVLEYLTIRSWSDCNKEVKFLENEEGLECLTAEKRDVGFLNSLVAFMIYCRCTLFAKIESVNNTVLQRPICLINGLDSDEFRCPISLEIMSDPVTLSTGQTYDRSSITEWFKSGNYTCPKTGERLLSIDLIPNYALKQLIKQYCRENGIPFAVSSGRTRESSTGEGSAAAEQTMALLATFLVTKLVIGTDEERNKATYEIRLLTKTSIFNRSCLVESDSIPPLLDLVSSSSYPEAQANAMASLMNLSKYSKSKRILIENGGLKIIVDVLINGVKMESRQHAAGALFYLASVEEHRQAIGEIPGAIQGLMGLVAEGPDRGKKNALVTILGLLMYPENHWRVLSSGVITLLNDLLTYTERDDLIIDSLAILSTLAEKLDGAMAIMNAGTLPIVIKVLCSGKSKGANKYCVSLLFALCVKDGADVVPVLVKNSSLMVALYSIFTDGTSRTSKKASSLIRILHAYKEKSSYSSGSMALSREQQVHVW